MAADNALDEVPVKIATVTTARCLQCDWTPQIENVDLAARKHTGESGLKGDGHQHATVVESVPA